jgi:hypothetical protein
MYKDFEAAGIPKEDERKKVYCFHSLRVTFGTWLAQRGTAPRVHMELMRHTDMKLTMRYYTDPRLLDTMGAMQSLPELGAKKEEPETEESKTEEPRVEEPKAEDPPADDTTDVHSKDKTFIVQNRDFERPDGSKPVLSGGAQESENPTGASANGVSVSHMARATGLEPATTGSTIRYSNQLSYAPARVKIYISALKLSDGSDIFRVTRVLTVARVPKRRHFAVCCGKVKEKRDFKMRFRAQRNAIGQ